MSSEHKGGVVFDYWVSNPWHGRASLKISTANAALMSPMAPAAANQKKESGDAIESDDNSTDLSDHTLTSVDDYSDEESINAPIPGGDAVALDDRHTNQESTLPRAAMPGRESTSNHIR